VAKYGLGQYLEDMEGAVKVIYLLGIDIYIPKMKNLEMNHV
jgi:hypothetical protein